MRPGLWQVIIIVVLIALLFGAKKIPELARSIGKAKGEFKKGLAEGAKEEEQDAVPAAEAPAKEIAKA